VKVRLGALLLILTIIIVYSIVMKNSSSDRPVPRERLELPPDGEETYIIFLSGLESYCDGTPYNNMGFEYLRGQLNRLGLAFNDEHFLMYSYTGGKVRAGRWYPNPYAPEDTGQPIQFSVMQLKYMIEEFTSHHPRARYLLVGHSLGGRIAFDYVTKYHLEKPSPIKGLVTLNSPLVGLLYSRVDILAAFRTIWGSPAVKQLAAEYQLRNELGVIEQKKEAARKMTMVGIHLATFGTKQDIIVKPLLACLSDEQGYPLTKGDVVFADILSGNYRDLFGHFQILHDEKVVDYVIQVYCSPSVLYCISKPM